MEDIIKNQTFVNGCIFINLNQVFFDTIKEIPFGVRDENFFRLSQSEMRVIQAMRNAVDGNTITLRFKNDEWLLEENYFIDVPEIECLSEGYKKVLDGVSHGKISAVKCGSREIKTKVETQEKI